MAIEENEDPEITIDEYPLVADRGEHQKLAREVATAEIAAKHSETINQVQFALYQVSMMMEVLRENPVGTGIDKALNQKELIRRFAALNELFRQVFRIIKSVIAHFIVELEIDTATQRPALNVQNTKQLVESLRAALMELKLLRHDHRGTIYLPKEIVPSSEMERMFMELCEKDAIGDETKITHVFNVFDEFLRGLVITTETGIHATIHETRERTTDLLGAAERSHRTARNSSIYDEPSIEEYQLWDDLLKETEIVLAESLLRIHNLFGQNVAWFLAHLDYETVRNYLWRSMRERGAIEKSLENYRSENDQSVESKSLFRRLAGVISNEANPPVSSRLLKTQIQELTVLISQLKTVVADMEKMRV